MFQRLTENRLSLSTFCSRQLTYWCCFWTSMNIMLHNPSRIVCVHLRWFLLLDTVKSNHLQKKPFKWKAIPIAEHAEHGGTCLTFFQCSLTRLARGLESDQCGLSAKTVLQGQGWWCRSSASYLMGFIFLMSLKTQLKINVFHILIKTAVKSHEVMLQFIVAS